MNSITQHEEILKSISTLTGKTVRTKKIDKSDLHKSLLEIFTGDGYSKVIEELRKIEGTNARQEYKKKNLPFFTIGEFKNNERKRYSLIRTQFAIYDFDHIGEHYDERWDKVVNDKRVFAAFRSPSGDGIKMICKFDAEINDANLFSELYRYYANKFEIELGGQADNTSDCSRACFVSFDPSLFLNPDADLLDTNVILHVEGTSKKTKEQKREIIEKLKTGVKAGEPRTPILTSAIGMLMKNGINRELAKACALGLNKLNEDPHENSKVIYTVDDMYNRYRDQSLSEQTVDFYSYETGIFEARIVGDEFSIKDIGKEKFFIKMNLFDQDEKMKYFSHVVRNNDLHTLRRIDYVSDVTADKSFYTFDADEGVFSAHIKAAPIILKDNDFIENYLDGIFGTNKTIIKEWLAVYTYSNYRKLPHLIFTGKRGTSKSRFVEMISSIFPTLSSWTKELEGNFNPDAEKKLVVIDESDSKGKIQYRTLKKYAGQSFMQVNKKYLPQYQVRNNVNLIILSNDDEAIYVEREEVPTNESNNQFFVHKFHEFRGTIDPDFLDKLTDRIGYYVRTELKTVFDSLSFAGNRYSIKVPITAEEKILFQNSITEVESESDELIHRLTLKITDPTFEYAKFVKAGFLPSDYFSYSYNKTSKNKIVKDLQHRDYLKKEKSDRYYQVDGKRPYSYKISDKWMAELNAEMNLGSVGCTTKSVKDMFVPMVN